MQKEETNWRLMERIADYERKEERIMLKRELLNLLPNNFIDLLAICTSHMHN